MHEARIKRKLLLVFGLVACLLQGCSVGSVDPDEDEEEGGVIGTGLLLEGTVTDVRAFASNSVQIKSSTGEISSSVIDDTGRYRAPTVKGSPPYILRADLGNNEYRYGIAFGNERTNVNSYSDVILRNWFAGKNGNLDVEFEQALISTVLPTRLEFQNNANRFFELVELVLESYDISGNQLLEGDFDSGTVSDGIDIYLRNNPVLVKDDIISFVITDPATQTQSTLSTGIALYDLATEPDTELPQIPQNVRALASAENEIVVVWEPSTDNRAVVGYEVFRDGVKVAVTPYPVLDDSGLEPNQQYTYEIIAVDSSGNSSALSSPATSSTLNAPDTVAPAAPAQLVANPEVGRVDLTWLVQSDIADVVRFEIYRGRDNNPVEFLTSVTGTLFTDVSVASGVNYCYEIAAFDASNNASNRSNSSCVTSAGEEVASTANLPIPQVPSMAGLNIPATDSIPCTESWTVFSVVNSIDVDAGCYSVAEPIVINNGGKLNLSPGVVMKFASGTGVVVNSGGAFSSEGTTGSPVVLTGEDPTPGFWAGLDFNQSNSAANKLVNTVIEFAGGGETMAAVALSSSTGMASRVDISGSVIRNCLGAGVRADTEFVNVNRIDGSVITGCSVPLDIHLTGLSGITQRNDFSDNENNVVQTREATVDSDMQLKKLGIPYVSSGIFVADGNLHVLNGVEIQLTSGANIRVAGSLTLDGQEDSRVKITGTVKERGHWGALEINGSATMNYADIEFGGFGFASVVEPANLRIATGSVSMSHVSISQGSSYAIYLRDTRGRITSMNDVLLSENSKTIRLDVSQLNQLSDELSFSSNDSSTIELTTSELTNIDVDLLNLGVPYLLTNSTRIDTGSFRIRPGVSLFMDDAVGIDIGDGAYFNAVGTAESPITITHDAQLPGAWRGITVSSNSNLNRIEHATVSFAGGSFGETPVAVKLACNPQAMLFLANTRIEDSAGWGVASSNLEGCALTFGENVQFSRNLSGDILVE